MHGEIDYRRRLMMLSAIGGAGVLATRSAYGQDFQIPSVEETLALLSEPGGAALLYVHFGLAFSIGVNAVAIYEKATLENPAAAENIPLLPSQRPESGVIFSVIRELSNDSGRREEVVAALSDLDDPLDEEFFQLLESYLSSISDLGMDGDSVLVGNAVESMIHVERMAAVTVPTDNGSYLCRIFPFKYFCG